MRLGRYPSRFPTNGTALHIEDEEIVIDVLRTMLDRLATGLW